MRLVPDLRQERGEGGRQDVRVHVEHGQLAYGRALHAHAAGEQRDEGGPPRRLAMSGELGRHHGGAGELPGQELVDNMHAFNESLVKAGVLLAAEGLYPSSYGAQISYSEIARVFLVTESTVAQRIVRAKRTLAAKQIPFEVPQGAELAGRLSRPVGWRFGLSGPRGARRCPAPASGEYVRVTCP
ncbi:hypothetical protein E1267_40980 [Nonomuraea longispora]|uniref:Uncharacterized protein n=1 Tax=Nonomuraea longispora TaxID=1848320 RepID=A0A4R4MKK4_9ACTN|nr:hypothetical protein E1267_40980 [Nonomuraea longispora]